MFLFFIIIIIILIVLSATLLYIKNYTNYHVKDFFNPKKWKSFYISLLKKHLRSLGDTELYLKDYEMVNYAIRVARCFPCLERGKCIDCNCNTELKMNTWHEHCSLDRWGPFRTRTELIQYLKKFKLNFSLVIEPRIEEIEKLETNKDGDTNNSNDEELDGLDSEEIDI